MAHVALSTLRHRFCFYLNYSNLFYANHELCFLFAAIHVAFVHYIAGTTYI